MYHYKTFFYNTTVALAFIDLAQSNKQKIADFTFLAKLDMNPLPKKASETPR